MPSQIRYSCLQIDEKQLYDIIYQTMAEGKTSTSLLPMTTLLRQNMPQLKKIFYAVIEDEPRFFYYEKSLKMESAMLRGCRLHFKHAFHPKQMPAAKTEIQRAVEIAKEEIDSWFPETDYDKLITIHHYLQDTVQYDWDEFNRVGNSKARNVHAHSAYGALVQKKAVCDGISNAFTLLAQEMGLDAITISGDSIKDGKTTGHAWCMVKMNDQFYHIDTTWDINSRECMDDSLKDYFYNYFLLNDKSMESSHKWSRSIVPVCQDETMSFHRRNGCYIENLDELDGLIGKFVDKKKKIIRFRLSDSVQIPSNAQEYIGKHVIDSIRKRSRGVKFSYSFDLKTRCFQGKLL